MSFNIEFDYRFDEYDFFTPERKAIMEQAGNIWSSYIQDNFTSIPTEELVRFEIDNTQRNLILDKPIDDLLIFVSSVRLNSGALTLGEGSFFGDFIIGSDRHERLVGENFEPWLGTIEFNKNAEDKFFFDSSPGTAHDIPNNKQDFLSIALHEIGHVLGIGTAPVFSNQVENGQFEGDQSLDFENIAYYAFESEPANIETIPLYRMLNTQTNTHLFTADTNEFNFLRENQPQFQIEGNGGISFYVLEAN